MAPRALGWIKMGQWRFPALLMSLFLGRHNLRNSSSEHIRCDVTRIFTRPLNLFNLSIQKILIKPCCCRPDVVVSPCEGVPGEVLVVEHWGLVSVGDAGTVGQVVAWGYGQLTCGLSTMTQTSCGTNSMNFFTGVASHDIEWPFNIPWRNDWTG